MSIFSSIGKAIGGVLGSTGFGNAISALGTIGSIVGGSQQRANQQAINEANIQMQRETNALQEKMFNQNLDWQRESQEIQNEYNSMSSQLQRAQAAGVSGAALLGQNGPVGNIGASLGSSGSSIPSIQSPRAEMIDSSSKNMISNVSLIAKALSDVSSSRLNDVHKDSTLALLDSQLAQNWAKAKSDEAEAAYKITQNNLDLLYGDEYRKGVNSKLVQELKNMAAQYTIYMQQADYVKAQQLYQEAVTRLTDSNNELVKQQTPIVLENLKKTGRLILEQAKAASASANQSNAVANLTNEQAQTIRENRPNVVELTRNQARESGARAKVAESTTMQQIESWRNRVKLEGKQADQLDEAIRKAKKDNDWYEVDKVIDILSTISDEALGWASFGVSKLGRQSPQKTGTRTHVERYDANGDMTGYTDSVNEYLYQ